MKRHFLFAILQADADLRIIQNDGLRIHKRQSETKELLNLFKIVVRSFRPMPELAQDHPWNAQNV